MTIGVVLRGPSAGAALVQSLASLENVAMGSIGGFVSMVVLTKGKQPQFHQIQTGGVSALFATDGTKHLPDSLVTSDRAALISSGPNRPEPLNRFLAWDDVGNLVSGHRFPHTQIASGLPLNQFALNLIQKKGCDKNQLKDLMKQNDHLDAGLAAMDVAGKLFQGDTARVRARGDTANATVQTDAYAFSITLNSIRPANLIALLLAEKLKHSMCADTRPVLSIDTSAKICAADTKAVIIDDVGDVIAINTPEQCWFTSSTEGALIETGTHIIKNGICVGRIQDEPYVIANKGQLISLSGEQAVKLRYESILTEEVNI